MKMQLRNGRWAPNLAQENPANYQIVTNGIPVNNGYKPFPNPLTDQAAQTITPCGMYNAKNPVFNLETDPSSYEDYAMLVGTNTSMLLWIRSTYLDMTRSSSAYANTTLATWEFSKYDDYILATQPADYPQYVIAATSGWRTTKFDNLTTDFNAAHVEVIGDFTVFGDLVGNRNRVRWSAQGDPTDYTVSAATQSDFQDIRGANIITKIVQGFNDDGYIFTDTGIYRMTYVGAPTVFRIDQVSPNGTLFANSIVSVDERIFYLAEDGFRVFDGGNSALLDAINGQSQVGHYIYDNQGFAYGSYLRTITATVWEPQRLIMWVFKDNGMGGNISVDKTTYMGDSIICFNYITGSWSLVNETCSFLISDYKSNSVDSYSGAQSLFTLKPISIPTSLDAATTSTYAMVNYYMNKSDFVPHRTKEMTIRTGDIKAGRSIQIDKVRVIGDVDDSTSYPLTVYSRPYEYAPQNTSYPASTASFSSSGDYTIRVSGKAHQIELVVPERPSRVGTEYARNNTIYGFDVFYTEEGER